MNKSAASKKVECLNPNTGRKMNIDKDIYDLVSKAIYDTLHKKELTFTQITYGVKECFKKQHTKFEGSVDWHHGAHRVRMKKPY